MVEEIDYTTAACDWSDKDNDIIADYMILKELGLKNVTHLSDKIG